MKKPQFFYPVEKKPTHDILPGYKTNSKNTHVVIVTTPEGPRIVNFCSKGYALIKNEDIFKPFEKHLSDSFDVEVQASHLGYSKYYADFILKDKAFEILPKDSIFVKIRAMNSYDGSLRYTFSFGFWRKVCDNGLCIPLEDSQNLNFKMRHTPAAIDKWDKVVELATSMMANAKDLIGGYKDLAKRKLTIQQAEVRIKDVLENTKAPSKRLEAIVARVQLEHTEMKLPITDWAVYNAINYEINHSGKAPLHKKEKVDQQVLEYLLA